MEKFLTYFKTAKFKFVGIPTIIYFLYVFFDAAVIAPSITFSERISVASFKSLFFYILVYLIFKVGEKYRETKHEKKNNSKKNK